MSLLSRFSGSPGYNPFRVGSPSNNAGPQPVPQLGQHPDQIAQQAASTPAPPAPNTGYGGLQDFMAQIHHTPAQAGWIKPPPVRTGAPTGGFGGQGVSDPYLTMPSLQTPITTPGPSGGPMGTGPGSGMGNTLGASIGGEGPNGVSGIAWDDPRVMPMQPLSRIQPQDRWEVPAEFQTPPVFMGSEPSLYSVRGGFK